MKPAKYDYDSIILSEDLSSLFSAAYCAQRGLNVLVVNNFASNEVTSEDFKISPYKLPIIGLKSRDYLPDLFSLIGLKELDNSFLESQEAVTVVIGDHRFDYFLPYIQDEIGREFKEDKEQFSSFLKDIIEMESQFPPLWSERSGFPPNGFRDWGRFFTKFPVRFSRLVGQNIRFLYRKHKLPPKICSMLDAIIFVSSGIISGKFPAIYAVRLLVSVLNGVTIPRDQNFNIRDKFLKLLPSVLELSNDLDVVDIEKGFKKFKVRVSNGNLISSRFVVSGTSNIKRNAKDTLGDALWYPYSLYVRVDKAFIPSLMNNWLIFVDTDKTYWLDYNSVYVIRCTTVDSVATVRVTSFVPYSYFQYSHEVHRKRTLEMYSILKRLIPLLKEAEPKLFPDPHSVRFKNELSKSYTSIVDSDFVYHDLKKVFRLFKQERRIIYCGREKIPHLGFEGIVVSGLKAADRIMRRY